MKSIYIISLVLCISQLAFPQVKQIVLPKESNAVYKDGYNSMDRQFFITNQNLVCFTCSPEKALVSYFCNTDEQTYKDNVLGGDFHSGLAGKYTNVDTTQTWIDLIYTFSFQYNNENYILIKYDLILNGRKVYGQYKRLKKELINGKYKYYIDQRNVEDDFRIISTLLGSLKQYKMRMLVGADQPIDKKDKEAISKLVSTNGTILLNSVINLYNQGDKTVVDFFLD